MVSSDILARAIHIRHQLHSYPELGFEEYKTSELIAKELAALPGFSIHRDILPTAVIGILNEERSEKGVALRADIDALPIIEKTNLPYASRRKGFMHACGHDGHTAALLGAAVVLSEKRAEIPHRVIFVFQPAEESLGGARKLVNKDIISTYGIAAIFGFHGWPGTEVNKILSRTGPFMASADPIEVIINGTMCHASMPSRGADPILAGAMVVQHLISIPNRQLSLEEPSILSIGVFQAGNRGNIIPETSMIKGTLRTFSSTQRLRAHELIRQSVECITKAHNCTATLGPFEGYPVLKNTPKEVALLKKSASAIKGRPMDDFHSTPVHASEDFSFYLQKVPGAFWFLGLGETAPLHNELFDFNDTVLETAIRMHVETASTWTP